MTRQRAARRVCASPDTWSNNGRKKKSLQQPNQLTRGVFLRTEEYRTCPAPMASGKVMAPGSPAHQAQTKPNYHRREH